MKKGQKVIHERYGECIVEQTWHYNHPNVKDGVTLTILDPEGKVKFRIDRGGVLPRCYEDNFNRLKPANHV